MKLNFILTIGIAVAASTAMAQDVSAFEKQELPGLVATYKDIHEHPELSHFEERTSSILAKELREAGYSVTERVGVYRDGSKAWGVVGVMKNGAGPTLLVRGDMDALPIVEETGVAYASHVKAKNLAGQEVGVMHACGHDVHTTVLMGTARALAAAKNKWHGTLMIVGQPSEETIDGSQAMLADHLYERFGKPDMIIGLHDGTDEPAGVIGITSGPSQAGSTSVDVAIKGIGGHGAFPNAGRDPVVLAAMFVLDLQTIVSREEDPQDPAVVTVGSIHGGTRRNIIPDEVKLELTTRYFSEKSRKVILDGIKQMALAVGTAAGLPADKMPVVTVYDKEVAPIGYNDPAMTAKVKALLVGAMGAANVEDRAPIMASDDVGNFALADHSIPMVYYALGAADPAKLAAAKAGGPPVAGAHTSKFEPAPEPTIAAGVKSLTAVAMGLLQ